MWNKWIALILLCCCSMACIAGNDKKGKMLQKECKQVCRKLKAEGWTVYGAPKGIDAALGDYYGQLEQSGDDAVPIVGLGQARSLNVAVRKAMNHAAAQYATMQGSQMEGQASSDFSTQLTDSAVVEQESHSVSYSSSVNQKVKALKPVLTISRTQRDNSVEVQMYYIVKL